ncbi:MAG: hypothetical protein ACQESG_03620 [Nanobdellota archaeon]
MKGFFFSIDAIAASTIIVLGIVAMSIDSVDDPMNSDINFLADDAIDALSELKIHELNTPFITLLRNNGNITDADMNNSVLEQAQIFWAEGKNNLSTRLLNETLPGSLKGKYRFGFFAGDNDMLLNDSKGILGGLSSYKKFVSGIQEGKKTHQFLTKVSFTQIESKQTRVFHYFGGFVGQGNVTANMTLNKLEGANVTELELDLDIPSEFKLYINGNLVGTFTPSQPVRRADTFKINDSAKLQNFQTGDNLIKFNFPGQLNESYIGGGYIKVTYETKNKSDEVLRYKNSSVFKRLRLTGIDGAINLYDSFYIPGKVNSMKAVINYIAEHNVSNSSDTSLFINFGNTTVYRSDNFSLGKKQVVLNYSNLSSYGINRSFLSRKTVPFRIGYSNINYTISQPNVTGAGDAIVVTDRSGSMNERLSGGYTYKYADISYKDCIESRLNDPDASRIYLARCVDKEFSTNMLKSGYNRVGLTSYESNLITPSHSLSTNYSSIKGTVEGYDAGGGTCTSCGVWEALQLLVNSNNHVRTYLISTQDDWLYYTNGTIIMNDSDNHSWYHPKYNDTYNNSPWKTGMAPLGLVSGNTWIDMDALVGTSIRTLWDMAADAGSPEIDFTSGVNSTNNSFRMELDINYSDFAGPSFDGWDHTGNISFGGEIAHFFDDFEDGTLNPWTVNSGNAGIDATCPVHGFRVLETGGNNWFNPSIITLQNTINLSGFSYATLSLWVRKGGGGCGDKPEDGEDLEIQYHDGAGWQTLKTYQASGYSNGESFEDQINLPAASYHPDFTIRLLNHGSWSNNDNWYIDNVEIIAKPSDPFGLTEYIYINSTNATINKTFNRDSRALANGYFSFTYAINDSLFASWGNASCNLIYDNGTKTIWNESWNSTNNPSGIFNVAKDISPYLTNDSFVYEIECGAKMGPGSIIAFDNMSIALSYGGDDGWDWDDVDGAGPYGFDDDAVLTHNNGKIIINFSTPDNQCSNSDCSGAWGVMFYVNESLIQKIKSGRMNLSFTYSWHPAPTTFETSGGWRDIGYVKGRFTTPLSAYALGSDMENYGGDVGPDLDVLTDLNNPVKKNITLDITDLFSVSGYYYLDLGAELLTTGAVEHGAFTFDDILLSGLYINDTKDSYYFRKDFKIYPPIDYYNNFILRLRMDDNAKIYLNGNEIYTDTTPLTPQYWNKQLSIPRSYFKGGENTIAVKLYNNATPNAEFDAQLQVNYTNPNRGKAMLIMSDGGTHGCQGNCNNCPDMTKSNLNMAGSCPSVAGVGGATEQVIGMACWANEVHNISIYTVAFGDSGAGETGMNLTASLCDNESNFYTSQNYSGISEIYKLIAKSMIDDFQGNYTRQALDIGSDFGKSKLLPSSYLEFSYNVSSHAYPKHDDIFISANTLPFGNNITEGNFTFKGTAKKLIETGVSSYSGDYWTNNVTLNNGTHNLSVFTLGDYADDFKRLGDPYRVGVPISHIKHNQTTEFIIHTGLYRNHTANGSMDNRFFYTFALDSLGITPSISRSAKGCKWNVTYPDGESEFIRIPASYTGPKICHYHNGTYDKNDSIDAATYDLFTQLDVEGNGRLVVKLDQSFMQVRTSTIGNVPSLWGPSMTETRVWK